MLAELALLFADGRMPTGSHAHSGGLEAAVDAGLEAFELAGFIAGRLQTCGLVEAAVAAAANRAAAAQDRDALARLDAEAMARICSPALRDASAALGRSLLHTASRVLDEPPRLESYRLRSRCTPRPVALGVAAAAAGLGPLETATVSLHEDLAGVASAAVKLLPIDAAGAFRCVAALAPQIERCARTAAEVTSIAALPSVSAPKLELLSLVHAAQERRLFAT